MELYNLEFSAEAVREAAAAGRLLSMEIEFSRRCNFRCVYCYVENRVAGENELSPEESRNVIVQARDLGARKMFDWGGRLPKCNGGARWFPQADWKPAVECKGIRELDCERDISSRYESRF